MRLYSAYLNRRAAQEADSVFEIEHRVKQIYKDGLPLWELAKKESEDDQDLEIAESTSEVPDITKQESDEINDIESVVNQAFKVIQEGVLLIHTELDQLKKLMKDDEVLRQSGFPIEVADQLEDMLKKEIVSITSHLREMGREIEQDKDL
jgi:hypothetical protein